jgi:tripartite-type tricarboxylate transporter receptor subunit TctC
MSVSHNRLRRIGAAAVVAALVAVTAACGSARSAAGEQASPEEAFQGRRMTWVVSYEAGDSQDIAARTIAEYFTKHLPGNPAIEVQNMPGGGGLSALQYVHRAEADGLTLLFSGGSPPVEQLLNPYREEQQQFVDFDITDFEWIGGTGAESNAVWVNTQSGISTVDQLVASPQPVKAAATRPGSNTYVFLSLLREVSGAPIDIVTGYESGSDSALALFRNEVQLQGGTWSTLVANHKSAPEDVLRPLVILSKPVPESEVQAEFGVPGVPMIEELTTDAEKKALIDTALVPLSWGRLLAAPPGTPAPLVEALRTAYDAVGSDPEFAAALQKRGLKYTLIGGAEVDTLIDEYLHTPEPTVRRYLELLGES